MSDNAFVSIKSFPNRKRFLHPQFVLIEQNYLHSRKNEMYHVISHLLYSHSTSCFNISKKIVLVVLSRRIISLSTVHFLFEYFKDPSKENNDAKNNRVLLFPKTSYFWEHLSHA